MGSTDDSMNKLQDEWPQRRRVGIIAKRCVVHFRHFIHDVCSCPDDVSAVSECTRGNSILTIRASVLTE